MKRDSMVQFDGYLRKQGISYKDHGEAMVALSDIDKMEFVSHYNFNLPIEDLIASRERSLEWVKKVGGPEEIAKIEGEIHYLASLKLKQLTLGVA
ncbi:hypothetical protein PM10SUCC1_32660 [Propionigenium maris DSM 9537]|uniref:Uncharacterized protein n=1 Tax=Propionigenium maris DSM 9537 TaxID=1123000 RepID=A0A9W6LPM5_9FUSO|nr:hypothetical protein [Propionigenium maris]GLI57752.1 hypothetical protein PM10SUCC1_32660 [Propionigenium maris DSM 9537]